MTRIKWSHLFIRFNTFISVAYMFKFSKEGCMLKVSVALRNSVVFGRRIVCFFS